MNEEKLVPSNITWVPLVTHDGRTYSVVVEVPTGVCQDTVQGIFDKIGLLMRSD